jgi:heme/copper-type cytochrome/quinol oxidase subunit 2
MLVSTYGASVLHLVYWGCAAALLIVQLVLARRSAVRTWHEAIWVAVPALILVWLGVLSHRAPHVVPGNAPRIAHEQAKDSPR